jgi:hypothetical protein
MDHSVARVACWGVLIIAASSAPPPAVAWAGRGPGREQMRLFSAQASLLLSCAPLLLPSGCHLGCRRGGGVVTGTANGSLG